MTLIHDKNVNKIAEWNLLHDIIYPTKRANILNRYYSPIINLCMHTQKGRAKFHNFLILLDSGYSSTIDMGRLIKNFILREDVVMQWHTQAGSINTNLKVNIYLNLPETSATAIMTWNFHVDDLGKDRYYMILG